MADLFFFLVAVTLLLPLVSIGFAAVSDLLRRRRTGE